MNDNFYHAGLFHATVINIFSGAHLYPVIVKLNQVGYAQDLIFKSL